MLKEYFKWYHHSEDGFQRKLCRLVQVFFLAGSFSTNFTLRMDYCFPWLLHNFLKCFFTGICNLLMSISVCIIAHDMLRVHCTCPFIHSAIATANSTECQSGSKVNIKRVSLWFRPSTSLTQEIIFYYSLQASYTTSALVDDIELG